MKVVELFQKLNELYPIDSQDEWDKSGYWDFGFDNEISNPILSLDISLSSVNFAIENNSNLIISHHPIFINDDDLKQKHIKEILSKLKKNSISVISLHTCFDKHRYGTSYQIIKNIKGFNIFKFDKSPYLFLGKSKSKISLEDLIIRIKKNLDIESVNTIETELDFRSKKNLTIAVAAGAGSTEIDLIRKKDKVDYFITSEIKWHTWVKNQTMSFKILEIPHSSEKVFLKTIKEKFRDISFVEFIPKKLISL